MKTLFVTLACVGGLILAGWLVSQWLPGRESRAFDSVSVGDSEEKLLKALTRWQIAFQRGRSQEGMVYSHTDGLFGVYFYYVENGRIVSKVAD